MPREGTRVRRMPAAWYTARELYKRLVYTSYSVIIGIVKLHNMSYQNDYHMEKLVKVYLMHAKSNIFMYIAFQIF